MLDCQWHLGQVFMAAERLYAFKGLSGKLGPIGVHVSLLAIMAGLPPARHRTCLCKVACMTMPDLDLIALQSRVIHFRVVSCSWVWSCYIALSCPFLAAGAYLSVN